MAELYGARVDRRERGGVGPRARRRSL